MKNLLPRQTIKKRNRRRNSLLIIFLLLAAGLACFFIVKKNYFRSVSVEVAKKDLPTSVPFPPTQSASASATATGTVVNIEIPEQLNLDIPFTSQAPRAIWDHTHEEACEEAAILMAGRYFSKGKINGPEDAEKALQEIIDFEMKKLGFFESTTAKQTAEIIESFYGLNAELVFSPDIKTIKRSLAENKLVIVPTAGQQLGNPFYTSPGPLYHMLLIKGYTADKFITNDAGTKRGENYPYKFATVLQANHDWNNGNVAEGEKVVIIVSK